MLVLLYLFSLQDSGYICFGYFPEKCCQRKKIINENSDCMPAMVLPVAREPKVSAAQRPGTVRPIMREAVCSKPAVKIRLLEGPHHSRAFAVACIAYTWYTCIGSWHHDFACLGKISHFCDVPFCTAQNVQICPDWVGEPPAQVLSYSPSLKNCYCLFYHHQNAPHPRYCDHDNDPNMIEKGQL